MSPQNPDNPVQEHLGSEITSINPIEAGEIAETYYFQDQGKYVYQSPGIDPKGFEIGLNLYEDLWSSDIPVPEVIERERGENAYAVLEYIPGSNLSGLDNPEGHLFYQAGQLLAKFHQEYDFNSEGYGELSTERVSLENPKNNWRRFFQHRTGSRIDDLRPRYVDISEALSLERAVHEKAPVNPDSAILHNDYAGRNIRVDPDSSFINGVIDFDSALVGDPDFDFVDAKQYFEIDFGKEEADVFKQGYLNQRTVSDDFSEKQNSYAISGLINKAWALNELDQRIDTDYDREIEDLVSEALRLS